MPIIGAKGAQSSQGFGQFTTGGGGGGGGSAYVEDVFNSYIYIGDSALTRQIQNGVNLSAGGMVWTKFSYYQGSADFFVMDSARLGYYLITDGGGAQISASNYLTSFDANGYTLGTASYLNQNGYGYISYSFAKKQKFFDVVTYTGNGIAGHTIAHNLGSTPGCIMVKNLSQGYNWIIYHRGTGPTQAWFFPTNEPVGTNIGYWNNTSPTSSTFTLGISYNVNNNGDNYVAYLFAHDAGGFGASGLENAITCGSFTTTGANTPTSINLGYEPCWVLVNGTPTANNYWAMFDNMRMLISQGNDTYLWPGTNEPEHGGGSNLVDFTPTGMTFSSAYNQVAGQTYVYVVVRRGPMKTPTDATKVFSPNVTNNSTGWKVTTNFLPDMQIAGKRTSSDAANWSVNDRQRGVGYYPTSVNFQPYHSLVTSSTAAENTASGIQTNAWFNDSFAVPTYLNSVSAIFYTFKRAPGFFDEVCYVGTGSATAFNHGLTVAPELMIVKRRDSTTDWAVFSNDLGNTKYLLLDTTAAVGTSSAYWNNTSPTQSLFTVGTDGAVNTLSGNYVAYLFATCPGVSKVGTYTGNGGLLNVSCGFTGGARFVMIKRTDTTGNWYVWDTARGMVGGTDPSLILNSTAAEVNTNSVYSISGGFQALPSGVDVNTFGGTYLFFAIA